MDDVARFVADRDASLSSLDAGRILAFYRRWDIGYSADPLVFWGTVHKAITACTNLPIESRRASKLWLETNGMKSFDDGDL